MTQVQGVLDLSFYEIRDEADITKALQEKEKERVKAATLRATQIQQQQQQALAQSQQAQTQGQGALGGTGAGATGTLTATAKKPKLEKRMADEAYKAIRLSNNSLRDPTCFAAPLLSSPLLHIDFDQITWVDVSFNNLPAITDAFVQLLPNLCTLNMHANAVTRLSDIKKLASLKRLRSLTLCGNPVAESRHYRNMILHFAAPTLVQLDFGCVTHSERQKAAIWEQIHRKKLHPEEDN